METLPQAQVFGPYRLHAKIAQGGMAEVYLGTGQQKEFQGQFLAVKKLLPHLNTNKPFINLLIHEAKVGVLLNHPGIVSVFDLGSYRTDFFLAMEYVHGKSLDRVLERIKNGSAPKLPLEISTYIGLEVLRALAFAHQLKDAKSRDLHIIHRDVSPGNILLGYRGEVKLTDFGIATAEHRLQPGFTQTALGKLSYMAPEQAVNDPVVKSSDLYSLAVVLYEMFTGQLPFHADSANALYKKILDGKITDLRVTGPSLSAGLRDILTRCLNRSAQKRYQSAPELFSAIQKHFQQESEVDFSSRTIRQYYQKKLAEYLRLVFEKEIIHELGVIQNAFKTNAADEEFKITAPQDLKRVKDFTSEISEHTQVAPDLADESTRHYPLTKDERNKIRSGLPPEEALKHADRMPPQSLTDPHFRGAGYDMTTIPEYDLVNEDSSLRRISVKDKLRISALDKDEKETLNQQIPDLEIETKQALEAFEQSTFSGIPDVLDTEATGSMDRSAIFTDFEKIKADTNTDVDGIPFAPENFDKPTNPKMSLEIPPPIQNISSRSAAASGAYQVITKKTAIEPIQNGRRKWLVAAVLFLLVAGAASTFFLSSFSPVKSINAKALLPTQTISLILIRDEVPESAAPFLLSLVDKNHPDSLTQIESFYNREFKRYSSDGRPVLELRISDFSMAVQGLTKRFDAPSLLASSKLFHFFEELGFKRPKESPVLYIYFYAFDPNSSENPAFPDEFKGERPAHTGVVFAPSHPSMHVKIFENIAREIAFLFGAKDRRDATTGMPLVPEGLANPQERPLYPQTKAELMAKDIPINALQKRTVTDVSDIVIGAATAYELGWIDIKKRDELLKIQ